jgi:hypothetical protein
MVMRGSLAGLLAILSVWCTCAFAADAVIPPGSSFGLVPPTGFAPGVNLTGYFDRSTDSMILLTELPPQVYEQVRKADDSRFAGQGMEVSAREDFASGAVQGLLLIGTQRKAGRAFRKWVLFFPTESFMGMVAVTLPEGTEAVHTDAEIRAALATVTVGAQKTPAEMAAALPFSFAATERLRVIGTMGGTGAMLAIGPAGLTSPTPRPTLIISLSSPPCPAKLSKQAESDLHQFYPAGLKVTGARPMPVAGLQGIEAVADAVEAKSGAPVKTGLWLGSLPAPATFCVRILGTAPVGQAEEAFAEFREVVASIRLKAP